MSMLLLPAPVPMLRITHAYRERLKARERFAAANAVSREPPALLSFAVTRERAMFVATVYENFRDETGGHWTRVFIESCAFPSKSEANEWAARRVDAETINATAQRSKIPNGVQAYLTEDMLAAEKGKLISASNRSILPSGYIARRPIASGSSSTTKRTTSSKPAAPVKPLKPEYAAQPAYVIAALQAAGVAVYA